MQHADHQSEWLTLDNAARIYPASMSDWSPDLYRFSVTLREPIRVSALADALRTVFPRFPYFQVHLRRGLFWYYLQRDDQIPELHPMSAVPVSVMPLGSGGSHLVRVQARGATLAIDFSHILTDGSGALRFLGTLVTQYLRLRGVRVTHGEPFLDPQETPSPEEYEDAYSRYFDSRMPSPPRLSAAYHLPDPALSRYRVITGRMPAGSLLELARARGVSLTEYCVALYMHSLAKIRASDAQERKPAGAGVVRIEVPVDMRRFHATCTMRNFSLYVSPEIDLRLGHYSFSEILERVHHSMNLQVDRKQLDQQIARNVRAERNRFIRILPLFLKDLLLSHVRQHIGETPYSGVLSNLGRIPVPDEIDPHIASFGIMLGPNPRMKVTCTMLTFRDDLSINFGSVIEHRELERRFFSHLARAGVPVFITERNSDS